MPDDDFQDIHDALGIVTPDTASYGPNPAAKFLARGAGELTGVNDLVRAVQSGRPENMLYAGGMLAMNAIAPEEKAAMTVGKLFPEATWLGGSALMHPQTYVDKLGGAESFAKNFPASYAKLEPYLEKNEKSLRGFDALTSQYQDWAKKEGLPNVSMDEQDWGNLSDIQKGHLQNFINQWDTLASKELTNTTLDTKGPSSPAKSWNDNYNAALQYAKENRLTDRDFGHEVPFGVPPQAQKLGFTTPALHGTPDRWGWEGSKDQLKLPDEQLGVHFGNPNQAAHFATPGDIQNYLQDKSTYRAAEPRTYPVVLQVQHPLETKDMGSWGLDEMKDALSQINRGKHIQFIGDDYGKVISPHAQGEFPQEELDQLNHIGDMRDYLASKGYDSIKYVNSVEDKGHTSYILFQDSPTSKGYVIGARSPFAQFDPSKLHLPSLAASGTGILAYPLASRNGGEEQ